uniref:Uncharacterized protein LOC113786379 isoform X2 n=1 Tax=Cicer arietinum TaxID=3827 RepID=A0A3Q7YAT5_CICAR|nr:uncharacterized protein LOC113786379 isoform X2 [Cicer arietinum]
MKILIQSSRESATVRSLGIATQVVHIQQVYSEEGKITVNSIFYNFYRTLFLRFIFNGTFNFVLGTRVKVVCSTRDFGFMSRIHNKHIQNFVNSLVSLIALVSLTEFLPHCSIILGILHRDGMDIQYKV